MASSTANPLLEPFLRAADHAAETRAEVDLAIAHELMREAAVMLHNGLALDGLDAHDTDAVVSGLSHALIAIDPTAAVRACARAAETDPAGLHDPDAVQSSYLIAASILQL